MFDILVPALRVSLVTWALCGIAYPFVLTGLGQWLMPIQANGSLVTLSDGTIIGSRLIGQQWTGPEWFHGRPSATTGADPNDPANAISSPYNAANSTGSNLGPASKVLAERVAETRTALDQSQPELTAMALPADMVTASGSGLDPDITPANAALQVARVAAARGIAPAEITALLQQHLVDRSLGLFGEPRINVLALNLALEHTFPRKSKTADGN